MSDSVHRNVADIAVGPVARVDGTTTLAECARMLSAEFDALIVFEPVRIISARDVVNAIAGGQSAGTVVDALDLERAYCISEATAVTDVVTLVVRDPTRRIVVQAADGRLLGRLKLAAVVCRLVERSPWIEALQFALRIEQPKMEIEP